VILKMTAVAILSHSQALGEVEASRGALPAARAHFAAALAAAPRMPHTYAAWAGAEAAAGNVQQARQLFQRGAQAVPRHAPLLHVSNVLCCRYALATNSTIRAVHRSSRRLSTLPSLAVSNYTTIIVFVTTYNCCFQAWASLELQLGALAAARQLLQQALAACPDHIPSYQVSGRSCGCKRAVCSEQHV
jgi:tetratricopeptide (TPR) repeat protein